jgi:hypothetical protein
MGKRELVLIVAFLAVGALVYRLTAPAAPASGRRFSVSDVIGHIRDEIRGQNYRVETRREARIPVSTAVRTLAIREFRGQLTITGGDGSEATAELVTDVYGADESNARTRAQEVRLAFQEDADTLGLALERPASRGRPQARLEVRIPARLAVDLQGAGRIEIRNAAAVRLETRLGDVTLRDVAGRVEGEHRDGALAVTGAGEFHVNVRRSAVRVEQVRGGVAGEFSDGRLAVRDAAGLLRLETSRVQVETERTAGEVRLTATDGSAAIRQPGGPVTFRGRRCDLSLVAGAPIAVTASSTDAPIELRLPDAGVTLDLLAEEGGTIDADAAALGLSIADVGTGSRKAAGDVAGGGPTWRVRMTRGTIVVRR